MGFDATVVYNVAMAHSPEQQGGLAARFATTHWTDVLAAGDRASPESRRALAALCEAYWYPIYAYARRRGLSVDDAQDMTQQFFTRLLEKNDLQAAKKERGRFRSFLLTCFKYFLSKERDRARAQKRGGARRLLSLNLESGERQYRLEPSHEWTPERIYERRWALTVLDQVFVRLREYFASSGKQKLFDQLKPFLTGEGSAGYSQIAANLGIKQGSVKVTVHRLRQKYRELLRDEISQTVADPEEIEDELRELLNAIRSEKS